jgi:hypothetical protein
MKTIVNKIIIAFWIIVSWLSMFPMALAQGNNDCNKFWAKCHVEDINDIHTKDKAANANLLTTIKNAINWCLGLLATIVLCFCIYGWFKMLTSVSYSIWYVAGRMFLNNALLWLAIILLAWMIVSVVFWFVSTLSQSNQTNSDTLQPLNG